MICQGSARTGTRAEKFDVKTILALSMNSFPMETILNQAACDYNSARAFIFLC